MQQGRRYQGELWSGREVDVSAFSDTTDSLWFKDEDWCCLSPFQSASITHCFGADLAEDSKCVLHLFLGKNILLRLEKQSKMSPNLSFKEENK